MALQHLYSRVPAKISMYNRADGYDTFACSEGIDRTFVEKELMACCGWKPTAEEFERIRKNEMPPIYSAFSCKTGEYVQSCTSFISRDYTGERSSYMVHSFVLPAEEKKALLSAEGGAINPDAFCKDLDQFNITDPSAKPIYDYPACSVNPGTAYPTSYLLEKYDEETMKRFIYGVIAALCGKAKCVFFSLIDQSDSLEAVHFINSFMQILPYHMRGELSFVTEVGDVTKYSNFALKCISQEYGDIPASKGIAVRFKSKAVTGIKENDYNANLPIVDFFFSLIENDVLRREFLLFARDAVNALPAMEELSLKVVQELVFLFRCGSGFYKEEEVLPTNAKVLELLTMYEKRRTALNNEYRVTAIKCLRRYPDNHMEIPKDIFNKVNKIYPGEPVGVKHVIMDVVLDLIHTDFMREKLFNFIKSNYDSEDEDTKASIIGHLGSVFYGGFLQKQILTHFDSCFSALEPAAQATVLEKVLLSIRTKVIQQQILEFLEKQYSILSDSMKVTLFETVMEQLREGDELAEQLISFMDRCIPGDTPEMQDAFRNMLITAVEEEQRRREHPLVKILIRSGGVCNQIVVSAVLTQWQGRKIFGEFTDTLFTGSCLHDVTKLVDFASGNADIEIDTMLKLIQVVGKIEPEKWNDTVEEILSADSKQKKYYEEHKNATGKGIASLLVTQIILPHFLHLLPNIFSDPAEDAMEKADRFSNKYPEVKEYPEYQWIVKYMAFKNSCLTGNMDEMFKHFSYFQKEEKNVRVGIAGYIERSVRVSEPKIKSVVDEMVCCLKTDYFHFDQLFEVFIEYAKSNDETSKKSNDKDEQKYCMTAFVLVMRIAGMFYSRLPKAKTVVFDEKSGIPGMFSKIIEKWGNCKGKLEKLLHEYISVYGNEFYQRATEILKATPVPKKGILQMLFKKK